MLLVSKLDEESIEVTVSKNLRYGILLSGGLDSAVLLFLLMTEYKNLNLEPNIKIFTIPKTDGSYLYVPRIISKINEKFNSNLGPTTLVGSPHDHHTAQVKNATKDIFKSNTVDELFIATNQNPPEEEFDFLQFKNGANVRSKEVTNWIHKPFFALRKSHIIDFMYQLNAEELATLTHSCIKMTDTRCTVCFPCKEREWAFFKNRKEDLGIF
jgi:arginyl-tRNA synthetase